MTPPTINQWMEDPLCVGYRIFSRLKHDKKPYWIGDILEVVASRFMDKIWLTELMRIAKNKNRWKQADILFQKIRSLKLSLNNDQDSIESLLFEIAENSAKVIFNSTDPPARYDERAGWVIFQRLLRFCDFLQDEEFRKTVWRALSGRRQNYFQEILP